MGGKQRGLVEDVGEATEEEGGGEVEETAYMAGRRKVTMREG